MCSGNQSLSALPAALVRLLLPVLLLTSLAACRQTPPPVPRLLDTTVIDAPAPGQPATVALEPGPEPVLLLIEAPGVNLQSRIVHGSDDAPAVLSDIAVDFLRTAPVWHLLEPATGETAAPGNSLRLEIRTIHALADRQVHITRYALDASTRSGAAQLEAWREFTRGLQYTEGEAAEAWEPRLAALQAASRAFSRLGLRHEALWSRYFHAYFAYYPLYRYSEALADVEDIIEEAASLDDPRLLLLAHQLSGQIRIEREADADPARALADYERAQQAFTRARRIAEETENAFELIWATNNSGITWHYQDRPEEALEQYARALERSMQGGDSYLVYLIGTNMAVAHEKLGRITQSIDTLLRMFDSLDEHTQPHEVEHLLNLLGMYYIKLYRFPEALEVLDRAIALSQEQGRVESLGRNRLLLAEAYREMGQSDKSRLNLELAIPDLEASRNGRGLRRAYDLRADLERRDGEFTAMRDDRSRQEQYLATDADHAEWLSGAARDAEAAGDPARAAALFDESANRYASTPFREHEVLNRLHACRLVDPPAPSCALEALEDDYAVLAAAQASVPALEGRYVWARLQTGSGQQEAALATLQKLITDMQYLRQRLPGVLGAWYWDARREIFDTYMHLALNDRDGPGATGARALSALLWLRGTGAGLAAPAADPADRGDADFTETARVLLAQRAQAQSAEETERAQRQLDQHLLLSRPGDLSGPPMSAAEVVERTRALPEGWSLLTFYAAPDAIYAWTGDRNGLRLHRLPWTDGTPRQLARLKETLRAIAYPPLEQELAEWGTRLIEPLRAHLAERVLFVGSGVFSDFPIEALKVDGEHLLQQHAFMNLAEGFELRTAVERLQRPLQPQNILLAGNPTDLDRGQAELAGTAAELAAIRSRFPNAHTELLAGPDLTRERLTGPGLNNADLVHIASHAVIDRAYPEFSSIRLSGRGDLGAETLTPADLGQQRLQSRLVVLSACSTVGVNRFEFDTHLGFVSAFLEHGSEGVVASLWPVPDQHTARLMSRFYTLAREADLATALRAAKLESISNGDGAPRLWAAFQLFLR
ncbi:CHAT domain-containing tetratricopeptide repeat protein [Elongatibacter sediminis]|uniref:CHAT domain-containing tetratricopeptide repeat protein n=1 Tax=Elongatibacter sediminis TaxID=3119006 RepID=A0AAW9R8V0_9GAMM